MHPIRGRVPGQLSNRPAFLAPQPREQPQHDPPRPPTRLPPREPARDPPHQVIKLFPPPAWVYPEPSGHRRIVIVVTNHDHQAVAVPCPAHLYRQVTKSGWSTKSIG